MFLEGGGSWKSRRRTVVLLISHETAPEFEKVNLPS